MAGRLQPSVSVVFSHVPKCQARLPVSIITRTIEIPLPEELLRLVDEKAQSAGLKRDAYIRAILSKHVTGEASIGGILSSFRAQVATSTVTV